jgi:hypothetical protein
MSMSACLSVFVSSNLSNRPCLCCVDKCRYNEVGKTRKSFKTSLSQFVTGLVFCLIYNYLLVNFYLRCGNCHFT